MKTLNSFSMTLTVLALTLTTTMAHADRAGAGGNGDVSDVPYVTNFIKEDLELITRSFLTRVGLNISRNIEKIDDREVKESFFKIMSEPSWDLGMSAIYNDGTGKPSHMVKINVKTDGPCFADGKMTDASTEPKLGATVCMSAWNLSRYSKSSLQEELVSLFFHELAHQKGFNERVATKLQNFIRRKYQIMPIIRTIRLQQGYVNAVSDKLDQHACFQLGLLGGLVMALPATRIPNLNEFTPEEVILLNDLHWLKSRIESSNTEKHETYWTPAEVIPESVSTLCYDREGEAPGKVTYTAKHLEVVLKFFELFLQDVQ